MLEGQKSSGLFERRKKILCVSSGGGHWVELLRLTPAFNGHDIAFATVESTCRDAVGPAQFYTFPDATRWDRWKLLKTFSKLVWIFLKERPDIVISTGALPGYFSLRLAKWFGARTIWLDSIANAEELSMSGQKIGKHADLWLTQWPHLARPDGPLYRGAVL